MMDRSILSAGRLLARTLGGAEREEDERDGKSTMPTTDHDGAEDELGESPENPGECSVGLRA